MHHPSEHAVRFKYYLFKVGRHLIPYGFRVINNTPFKRGWDINLGDIPTQYIQDR